ncbi:MAG: tyrosine-type recombinase/integrase [Chloroflexi bacterium]|nr:tyrosine-type recombinase/integrase [Chloroflexota bacterium]
MIELGEEADAYLALKKKSTRTTYQNQLRRFLRWYKSKYGEDKGFDHLLDQMDKNQKLPRRDRKHVAETIMVEYIDFLKDEEGLANHTIRTGFTALQNFLKSMNYEMSGIWIGNLPSATSRKENSKQRWTIEQISEFVEKAPSYRDKAAILVMFQSGMAVNELMSLDYGDIEAQLKSGNLPILIDMTRKKTGVEYRTCIGADAVNYLKTYLKTRKNLKSKSPLFTKIGSEKRLTRVIL